MRNYLCVIGNGEGTDIVGRLSDVWQFRLAGFFGILVEISMPHEVILCQISPKVYKQPIKYTAY